METFWNTIARYNEGTWMAQAVITLTGILLTILLYRRPTPGVKRTMKAYMVFLNGWISAVYYMAYGGTRSYHYITFERNRRYGRLVAVLYAMPFLYPLLSWARGMEFPMMTTTVMPCSVAVFTIGLLLGFSRKVNLLIILFLCHWALIAFSKIYVYQIPEDTLLAAATVPAIYLFFKNYFDQNLHKETKPSARAMNGLLIVVCAVIGVALSLTLLNGLTR